MSGTANRWWLLFAVPTALLGVLIAWGLASPAGPEASSTVRVLAIGCGSVTLGIATLAWMGRGERRPASPNSAMWTQLTAIAAVWLVAEIALLALSAAAADGQPITALTVGHFATFVGEVNVGRVGAAIIVCAFAVVCYGVYGFKNPETAPVAPALVVTALALATRPITGHMAQQSFGSILDAIHVLAAGLWFGVLAALALAMPARGAWALWLPKYSALAWRCVLALVITGVVNAAVRLGSVTAFVDTAYGRVVLAKLVAVALLLGLGWWWRRTWVVASAAHRMSADGSLRRAIGEVVLMAVAFGLAAALATTA
ncbi:copper resistance protein CopD [Rhodococcus sp. ACPA4]|uniref:CopD family protein n=1 Tax=Rhodococcus globerulus TaxID=33008 RepID=A0ABU4BTX5_RHOGO|nr:MULTISPECIES: CopD family protein [Rhodococcus]NRI68047.1 copper resistance protein CopD [Rhodococcus sp. MS16]KJF25020.1 putative copper export protein [Rhodococcus sp. AD45]MCE4264815.1 CopD family protein [Rhodococcus globerulus]MDV6267681.1 CopD family protein [Rhodococcus globerulus]MDV8065674.1 CopD family protein [Rhodococcus sp. IEGM 1366]